MRWKYYIMADNPWLKPTCMERLPSRAPFYRLAVTVGGSSAPAVVISGSTAGPWGDIHITVGFDKKPTVIGVINADFQNRQWFHVSLSVFMKNPIVIGLANSCCCRRCSAFIFFKSEPLRWALDKKNRKNLSHLGFEPRERERWISGLTAALKEDLR